MRGEINYQRNYIMTSILDPHAKLARANEHVQLLDGELKPFTEVEAYAIIYEFNNDVGKHIWRLGSIPPTIPLRVSTIVGDALFNFRSSLDHLVWQLVLANGKKPGRFNQFPIYMRPADFKSKGKPQIKGVSKQAAAIIERLQPRPGMNFDLMRLVRLNDIDKHRYLHLGVVSILEASWQMPRSITPDVHLGIVKYGTTLCTVHSLDMDVGYFPTFEIAFDEGQGSHGPVE